MTMCWLLVTEVLTAVAFTVGVCFSQIRGPAGSICSVVPPGTQLPSSFSSLAQSTLDFCSHTCQPCSQMATQGPGITRQHAHPNSPSSPSCYIARISNPSLCFTTTPKSIFHPTATMIFLTIKSVYIFPLLKHSYVTSRLSRKWKLLPYACKVLGTQPVSPLYLISCHLSSLLLCSPTVLSCCPSEIPCLVSLQALCTCYLLCMECFVASCYPYLSSKATY